MDMIRGLKMNDEMDRMAQRYEGKIIEARIDELEKLPSQMSGNKIDWTLIEILERITELNKGIVDG